APGASTVCPGWDPVGCVSSPRPAPRRPVLEHTMTASLPLTSRARVVALLTVLTLLVAACGGDDTPEAGSSTPTEAAEAAPTPTPTDTATAKPQPSIEPP